MAEFMFQDTENYILFFKGIVTIDEIEPSIWEEFFELPILTEVQKYFDLMVTSGYKRYGCGYDEDAEFRTDFLFDAHKGRGAFMVTEIHYIRKQHIWDCEHSVKMYSTTNGSEPVPKDMIIDFHDYWLECNTCKTVNDWTCKLCPKYQKSAIQK
jgi:hypothetical protein